MGMDRSCSQMANDNPQAMDSAGDAAYVNDMAESRTKEAQLTDVLDGVTVEGLDAELTRLSRRWVRVYINRQLLASEEGITSLPPPPPAPPKIGDREAAASAPPIEAAPPAADSVDRLGLTMGQLIQQYREDPRSPYLNVRHTSRVSYDRNLKRIEIDYGQRRLADLKKADLQSFHDQWAAGGKLANGHALITQTRMLLAFGADALDSLDCGRLSTVLRQMNFTPPERKSRRLLTAHVHAIINKARQDGILSVALAMAFQFGCRFLQADVLGEWVPITEPGEELLIDGDQKWIRGLRWSEIDANWILRRPGLQEINLKEIPLVVDELKRIGTLPPSGPIVVDEETGKPYLAWRYRRLWRDIADAAEVPKDVKNILTGVLRARKGTKPAAHSPEEELALTTRH